MSKWIKSIMLVSLSCLFLQARGQVTIEPMDREVLLTGVIKQVHGYGPPGYGEDKKRDARITYWIIELAKPINVACTPEKPEWASEDCRSTNRLKLFFPTSPPDNGLERKARTMQGQKIFVAGVLHRKDTAGEITPIYMNVTEVRPLPPPESPGPK
jgi:hypothetical protein